MSGGWIPVAIVAIAASFVVSSGGYVLVLGGCAVTLALVAVHVWPWRRPVDRTATALERDGVVEYRLSHIRELSRRHFGADYSQGGMHAVLRRMGFSWLKPRPVHPKTDLAAQEAFKKTSPRRWHVSTISIPTPSGWRSGSRTKPGSVRKAR